MTSRGSTFYPALVLWFAFSFHAAQLRAQAAVHAPPDQSTYTYQANTRVVLTDVTVMDGRDNPVHGLPESAFRIFDNNKPQAITSFEEHDGVPAAASLATNEPGVYSNNYLLHAPPVLDIVLIDIANLNMADQMYLNDELTKFLNEQPEGRPLAIYLRAGSGCFLVENFTADRKLLIDAVHKAIPRFPPAERRYLSDVDMLRKIALSLSELPGRKNVLWFSGGSAHFLLPDAMPLEDDAALRDLYDNLNLERIAVYPIDARGLEVIFRQRTQLDRWQQHWAMNDAAQATGGEAFYNNNGLEEISEHLLNSDSSFYSLTYSPRDAQLDNKWHKIRITVGGASYRLSYRRGYFADGSLRGTDQPPKFRTRLLANAEKLEVIEPSGQPIIFQASVLPASDPSLANREKPSGSLSPLPAKKGSVPFAIRFTVPLDALSVRNVDGKHQIVLGVAAVALNREGGPMEHKTEQVTIVLNQEMLDRSPRDFITLDQQLNLAKDDKFLRLGVWDTISGRSGNIQIPLDGP